MSSKSRNLPKKKKYGLDGANAATFLYHLFEIYSLKYFKFRFLNQIRIKIIGLTVFLHTTGVWGRSPQKPEANLQKKSQDLS